MNTPTNHHYVPQHFLAAWSPGGKLINRYLRMAHTGKMHFKKGAGIVNLGSKNNLYVIENTDGQAEFETTIVTALLDTPVPEIVKKVREIGIQSLSSEERRTFSHYVVMLEMRNPRTIALMSLSQAEVEALHAGQTAVSCDTIGAREAAGLLSSVHTGKMVQRASVLPMTSPSPTSCSTARRLRLRHTPLGCCPRPIRLAESASMTGTSL
jgi:hypothetical protein